MLHKTMAIFALTALAGMTTVVEAQQYRYDRDERGNIEGKRASCEVYAKLAQVQVDANTRYRCGFNGPRWTRDPMPHFRWCRYAPRSRIAEELRDRAAELQRCFDRMGDFDERN